MWVCGRLLGCERRLDTRVQRCEPVHPLVAAALRDDRREQRLLLRPLRLVVLIRRILAAGQAEALEEGRVELRLDGGH